MSAFKAAVEAKSVAAMAAALSPDVTFRSPAVHKAYSGSGKELVMAALRGHVSKEEKEEIRKLLQEDGK